LSVAFIISDQQTLHEGIVRPFINFASALKSSYKINFYLLNCSDDFIKYFKERYSFPMIASRNTENFCKLLEDLNPRFIFVDDELKRLKLVSIIKKKINAKILCYAQILYGTHSIVNCFDLSPLKIKQRIIFSSMKYFPFLTFRNTYTRLIKATDLIVANSKITATLLHALYNIEVEEIIYPSVDPEIFTPVPSKKKEEITVYLGSHLGDTRVKFIDEIIETSLKEGYCVNLFGSSKVASAIKPRDKNSVLYNSYLSDAELAGLYSRSKLTVCPQKWEMFGLVTVESLFCGTPVLAFNCMGFQETIDARTGWLANNESEFLKILHDVFIKDDLSVGELRSLAVEKFSVEASVKAWQQLLEKN